MSRAARVGLSVALLLWFIVAMLVWLGWAAVGQFVDPGRVRRFYIPSESMLPTLQVGDNIRPVRADKGDLRRGTVIVFEAPSGVRVARIVGVGGDVVSLHAGTVSIDGRVIKRRDLGPGPTLGGEASRLQEERLPDESHAHRLLDMGQSDLDDYGPVTVPAGTLFVLGDDRDRAADSRLSVDQMGVGFVPASAVIGIVDRLLWARGLRDLGRPIDAGLPR